VFKADTYAIRGFYLDLLLSCHMACEL